MPLLALQVRLLCAWADAREPRFVDRYGARNDDGVAPEVIFVAGMAAAALIVTGVVTGVIQGWLAKIPR